MATTEEVMNLVNTFDRAKLIRFKLYLIKNSCETIMNANVSRNATRIAKRVMKLKSNRRMGHYCRLMYQEVKYKRMIELQSAKHIFSTFMMK